MTPDERKSRMADISIQSKEIETNPFINLEEDIAAYMAQRDQLRDAANILRLELDAVDGGFTPTERLWTQRQLEGLERRITRVDEAIAARNAECYGPTYPSDYDYLFTPTTDNTEE